MSLAVRHVRRPDWLQPSRENALVATGAAIVVAGVIAIVAGLPHEVSHRWDVFKGESGKSTGKGSSSSALDFQGNGRYQFWQSAVDANATAPLIGTGPGTFEFWWSRNGSYRGFVRDAHSLYLQSLAELGIIGLLLIAGFVLAVLGVGAARSLRAPPEQRLVLAAATAGAAGFAMAAALDWVWQLAALSAAFMLLSAVAVAGFSLPEPKRRHRRSRRLRRNRLQRAGIAAVAVAALVAIWLPLRGATALQQSQIDAAHGDLAAALDQAHDAAGAQPYAASPRLQEALILEQQGKLAAAASAASAATEKESTDWRTWITLSRIEAERGRIDPSIRAYRRARALNPGHVLLK